MLSAARIAAGQRVLDIGSGRGDMALLAAKLVGSTGCVIATDVSLQRMAALTKRRRTLPQPACLEIRRAAAEDLALEPASLDAALARNCLMYVHDVTAALRNVRDALRSDGRLVASIYGPLAREPYHAIPIAAVARRRELREPLPEYMQAFRLTTDDTLSAFRDAGLRDLQLHVVAAGRTYRSLDRMIEILRGSPSLTELLERLPDTERTKAWDEIREGFRPFETSSGVSLPGEQRVIVGIA